MLMLPPFVGAPPVNNVYQVDAHLREDCGIIQVSPRAGNTGDMSQPSESRLTMDIISSTRRCTTCQGDFPATTEYFYKRLGGLAYICKACRREYDIANKDRIRAYQLRYTSTEEFKARDSARGRQRRAEQGEHINALRRKWYAERKTELLPIRRKQHKAWRASNPEAVRAIHQRRRARQRSAEGTFTADDLTKLLKVQKRCCYWCGKRVTKKYHVDHVIPLVRGGSNDPSNLVIACPSCNLSKRDRLPHEWGDKLF